MSNNSPVQDKSPPAYYYEDEISLIDLWLVLVKRRMVFAVVMILCLVAGLLYAFGKPVSYEYTTSIQIGTFIQEPTLNGPQQVMIWQPAVLLSKLKGSYIPLVMHDYLSNETDVGNVPEIKAQLAKGSEIVTLRSEGAQDEADVHMGLHKTIVDNVKNNHQQMLKLLTQQKEVLRQQAKNDIEGLIDAAKVIQARQKRINEQSVILTNQAEQARIDLRLAHENRERVNREINDETRSSTLLLIDGQISRQSEWLAKIEERLTIELPDTSDTLAMEMAGNHRTQKLQQIKHEIYEAQLNNSLQTRMLTPTTRSQKPVGPQKYLIIILSSILGLMLGIFAAFFAEFLSKARVQLRQAGET